jgi:HlyD family secretion protein
MENQKISQSSKLKRLLSAARQLVRRQRRLAFFSLVVIIAGGYYFYRHKQAGTSSTTYIMGTAEKGSIIVSVSGSGQIETSDQVDVKPNVAADIIAIYIKAGQKVKAGDIIAKLDDSDLKNKVAQAKNSLTSARANLNLKLAGATKQEIKLAENAVASAQLSYEQAVANVDDVKVSSEQSLAKAQTQLDNAQISLENAQRNYDNAVANDNISGESDDNDLSKTYSDAKSALESAQLTIRSAIVSADDILGKNNYSNANHPYLYLLGARDSQSTINANSSYELARAEFIKLEASNRLAATANWTHDDVEKQLVATKTALQSAKTMAHDVYNVLLNTVVSADLSQSTIDGYKQTASSQESSLLSGINSINQAQQAINNIRLGISSSGLSSSASVNNAKSSLDTAKNNLVTAQSSLVQAQSDNKKSLDSANSELASRKIAYENAKIQLEQKTAAPREVDLASARVQVAQAAQDYEQAVQDLADAEVKSPIDGVVAKVNQKVGYAASASDSDANSIATIITDQQLAVISLNEVDIAKVKVGQQASLSFTAIDGLKLTGQVAEVESIGASEQGVVSYEIKISLDSQDERVKPQMSVSAEIIIDSKTDVLVLDNSLIKTDSQGLSYVEVFGKRHLKSGETITTADLPEAKYIEIGLSNDTKSEIISGLAVEDIIIVQSFSSNNSKAAQSAATQRSGLQMMGGMGGGPR